MIVAKRAVILFPPIPAEWMKATMIAMRPIATERTGANDASLTDLHDDVNDDHPQSYQETGTD